MASSYNIITVIAITLAVENPRPITFFHGRGEHSNRVNDAADDGHDGGDYDADDINDDDDAPTQRTKVVMVSNDLTHPGAKLGFFARRVQQAFGFE